MLALYHNDMSFCAQKVRVGLAEKKLDWESRHLVLRAAEHQQPWYLELADVAFTPCLARLEHLNILGMIGERHRVADWYRRCKARPSFQDAIVKWENADYLGLMQRRGTESWPQVHAIMQAL
jgi:glutathione S-transferase